MVLPVRARLSGVQEWTPEYRERLIVELQHDLGIMAVEAYQPDTEGGSQGWDLK